MSQHYLEEDKNRLSGRIKRYAQVTSTLSALAARLAGEKYLGININRQEHAENLKQILGNLKGPLMKVAQILATIPDVLPREYVQELAQLQANAPPMGGFFVKRRMMAELESGWENYFSEFDQSAAAAASLGQVHKAKTKEGELVACKIQYPDMMSVIEADLEQLKFFLSVYESFNKAILTTPMQQEIAERLREELDYEREAKHLQAYRLMLQAYPAIRVPKVYPHLSTKRLLTMEWLEGTRVVEWQSKSQEERNTLAKHIFYAWYVPFYHYGIIHGDPHFGNYTISQRGEVNLLDYGCIRVFGASFVKGVIELYYALKHNNLEKALNAYREWGFKHLSPEIVEVLNLWAKFLYGPLLDDRVRPLQEGHSGIFGRELVDQVHRRLREVGGVEPPREFVLMDRAAVGVGSVMMLLKAELNWHQLFEELISDFNSEVLANRQEAICHTVNLNPGSSVSNKEII